MDFVIRNARLSGSPDDPPIDIGIEAGRIVVIGRDVPADIPGFDAAGNLACGGLVETHIHLDKSRIIDRCAPEHGRNADAVPRVAAVKHTFTDEDVYQRASQTLEGCIKLGTTRMRTHVELDAGVELRSFEALEALRRDYAWAIDIELCVFPQEGLTNNPRADALLVEALKRGAKVIGAAPNYDPDKNGQIRRIFELAREYDVDIDMHLDSGNSPADMDIHLVCELTREYGIGGRVAVGHGCKYSTLPPADLKRLATTLADAGVAVTVLPATDLFMMGRDQDHDIRRGVADANALVELGVNCSISSNNILNPVHAAGRRQSDPHGQPAGQCLPDQPPAPAAGMFRHADRAVSEADESEGLWHRSGQSGGHRGVRRHHAGAGRGGGACTAGCVQARGTHRDPAARRASPAAGRDLTSLGSIAARHEEGKRMKLSDIAQVIRSKNAGPRRLDAGYHLRFRRRLSTRRSITGAWGGDISARLYRRAGASR